jgi:WhiB family redox-sensing transcriptional regulator
MAGWYNGCMTDVALVELAAALAMRPSRPWSRRAACRGMDPEMFHPHPGETKKTETAKAVCLRCDVRAECLAEALGYPRSQAKGVWGGLSDNERRRLTLTPRVRSA